VIAAGARKRNQPAPPHAVLEALTQLDREPARPWLHLLEDEHRPDIVEVDGPQLVIWSSLWLKRPDARIRFDLPLDGSGQGSDLCWTLLLDPPLPEPALLGYLRRRLNELINADLRLSFGQ
jgi:hypothetical protein